MSKAAPTNEMKISLLWALVAVLLLVLAATAEYQGSEQSLVSRHVRVLTEDGNAVKEATVLVHAQSARLWQVFAAAMWALGSGIVISVFIIARLERRRMADQEAELEKLREGIHRDVFASLFSKLVPNEIFEVIKAELINCKLIRRDAQWIYDFRLSSDSRQMELKQTLKQRLCNIGHESVDDAIQVRWDREHSGDNGLVRVLCKIGDEQEIEYDRTTEAEGSDRIRIERGEAETTVTVKVSIPPGKHADITTVIKQVYEIDNVTDAYFARFPMINATLTASHPEDFEFSLFQSMSSTLKSTLVERDRSIYEAKGAILPGQGFVYSLKRRAG